MEHIPKSRGTRLNPKSRFDKLDTEAVDDGWQHPSSEDDEPEPDPRTTLTMEPAKSILAHNESPDVGFDQSINPYRGCEHGCVYCFARPSHAYLGLSPGLDFETKLFAKPNAAQLLDSELRKPSYRCKVIAVGTNTDPYQPAENRMRIMRSCLQVMDSFNQPVAITTKGFIVTRDIDILSAMAARGLAAVAVSVTTLDRDLCRRLEPRAATPEKRIEAIRRLAAAHIPVAVMVAPVIPLLTDGELEKILTVAREAGAERAGMNLMRLPYEVKDLFVDWLDQHEPGKAEHVLSLIRQSRKGKLNDPEFGSRNRGSGMHAELLAQRFHIATRKLGYGQRHMALDTHRFRPPLARGNQMSLFDM